MRRFNPRASVSALVAAAIGLLVCVPPRADTPQGDAGTVPAVWTPKELHFTFMGFTSRYSCDGLEDRIKTALIKLGARKDMQVHATACPGPAGRPVPFPTVTGKLNVLQPVTDQTPADAQTVQAHWQKVDIATLVTDRDPVRAAGECELVEQIKQSILPVFTTRNVEYRSTCVPNQLSIGGTTLKAEMLVADQPAAKTPASK
jgi:hypothetical protein